MNSLKQTNSLKMNYLLVKARNIHFIINIYLVMNLKRNKYYIIKHFQYQVQ
jgi:hypothetical protein